MSESKKAPKDKEKKEKAPKLYLTVRYETLKTETEKGKRLLDPKNETQSALAYRACSKKPVTFAEILAAVSPVLKGKSAETVSRNLRWYLNSLKKKGLLRSDEHKEEREQ